MLGLDLIIASIITGVTVGGVLLRIAMIKLGDMVAKVIVKHH